LQNKELKYKELTLGLTENISANIIAEILDGKLDGGLMATPLKNPNLVEYPIYYERFYAYVSPLEKAYADKEIDLYTADISHIWMFESIHYIRGQVERLCRQQIDKNDHRQVRYEAGNISTLINVVDLNAGMTIIPELAAMSLSEDQQANLKEFKNLIAVREVSLVVHKEYVRHNILNKVLEIIADSLPNSMKNPELKQYAIDIFEL
jgi:LysR family hydrogen peroxide-inducible transcriptional activator